MSLQLKKEYHDVVIGYNNSSSPLGVRKDWHVLLKHAKANKSKRILDMFEEVPTQEELLKAQETAFNEKQSSKKPLTDNKTQEESE